MLYVIAVIAYAIDQILKWVVRTHMTVGQLIPIFPPYVDLDYIRNPGGAFGILPHQRWLFILVAVVVVVAVVILQIKWRPKRLVQVGLGLVLAGAIGNMTDRVIWGRVVDYVYLQFINFPVFNFADVCIDAGVILLLIQSFRTDSAKSKHEISSNEKNGLQNESSKEVQK